MNLNLRRTVRGGSSEMFKWMCAPKLRDVEAGRASADR